MDAETVSPAFNARYTVEAPKIIPNIAPVMIDLMVSSAITVSAGTNGLKFVCGSAIQLILVNGRYKKALSHRFFKACNWEHNIYRYNAAIHRF